MNISLEGMSSSAIYHLMTQTVLPRPIAWVLSENDKDKLPSSDDYNLAPFSYFNAVCSDPPLCMLSVGKNAGGASKDTAANLTLGKYCVINIPNAEQAALVTASAATLEYGNSEIDINDIALKEQSDWPLPFVANCGAAFLCRVHSTQTVGNAPQQLIFVEIVDIYIDDAAVSEVKGRLQVDAQVLNPLARLGANQYANLGDVFTLARPK
jgi:flavin reductase (DIM6/NTAB) family NADH-FMN oxidoreductase RutF